jgi:predicted ATP-grasp superfamily ATP-dependent carboligase
LKHKMPESNGSQGTILITDAGRGSAISIIRSLGRKGFRVVAADSDPSSLGFLSRYTFDRLVYPTPEIAPRDVINCLYQYACQTVVDLIIPVTDAIILPLSEERYRFDGLCKLALPDEEALGVVSNKLRTLDLAKKVGVPAPRTSLVDTVQEAKESAPALGWPVVLKPQTSRLYREKESIEAFSVCYAQDIHQLSHQMQGFEGRCPVLLQEYYPGAGQGVELLLYRGRPLAAFQHRRLREIPIHGGASAFRESVPLDENLMEHAMRLLGALDWTGLAMVEFKTGIDGPKLMEINGRVWGSLPLAVKSGVDFPFLLANLYVNGPPRDPSRVMTDYRIGVRSRNLELEILWIGSVLRGKQRYPFLQMPRRLEAVLAVLQLFHPNFKYDVQVMDDPKPGFAEIPKIIKKLRKKVNQLN